MDAITITNRGLLTGTFLFNSPEAANEWFTEYCKEHLGEELNVEDDLEEIYEEFSLKGIDIYWSTDLVPMDQQKKVTYFLLGENAVRIYFDNEEDALVEGLKNELFGLFEYIDGETSPENLSEAFSGWMDSCSITKEDYDLLKPLLKE